MQATRPDAFGLTNSGLNAFLYADIGTELNGSPLTILSLLARLDNDPWAQAASWAAMPRSAAIDGLSQSIAQMPLVPGALAGSRDIAAHLVQFLPAHSRHVVPASAGGATSVKLTAPPLLMIWCAIAAWIGLTLMLTLKPGTNDARPAGPSIAAASAIASVAAPASSYAAAGAPAATVLPPLGKRTQVR